LRIVAIKDGEMALLVICIHIVDNRLIWIEKQKISS